MQKTDIKTALQHLIALISPRPYPHVYLPIIFASMMTVPNRYWSFPNKKIGNHIHEKQLETHEVIAGADICWIVGIGDLENIHYSRVYNVPMNL